MRASTLSEFASGVHAIPTSQIYHQHLTDPISNACSDLPRASTEAYGSMTHSPSSSDSSPSQYLRISAPQPPDAKRQSAALRGASLAFASPPTPSTPSINTYSGTDGALAAASFAGVGKRRKGGQFGVGGSPPRQLQKNKTPPAVKHIMERTSSNNYQQSLTPQSTQSREQSPSHIAAVLAASKSSPNPSPTTSLRPPQHRRMPLKRSRSDLFPKTEGPNDSPIAATDALVKLFEASQASKRVVSETQIQHKQGRLSGVVSPIPIRPPEVERTSPLASRDYDPSMMVRHPVGKPLQLAKPGLPPISPRMSSRAARASDSTVDKPIPAIHHSRALPTQKDEGVNSDEGPRIFMQKIRPQSAAIPKTPIPPPPPARRSSKRPALPVQKDSGTSSYTNHSASSSSASSYASAVDRLQSPRSPEKRSNAEAVTHSPPPPPQLNVAMPNTRLQFRPPSRPVSNASTSLDRLPFTTAPLKSGPEPILSLHSLTPQLTASSLANAMVASSLASSRAPSPSKPLPLPTPPLLVRRSKPPFFHRHHSQEQLSRTPSPAKGMRHTLRDERSSNDETEVHKHHKSSRIIKKHPHKHHEGDRKRWRESITDKERKRYEGVWAANRGLFLPHSPTTSVTGPTNLTPQPTTASPRVLNLIVRDIWNRSKLSPDDLAEIWDLVDGKREGYLEKEEFVVGMWLVDQRLKGRKTPVVVGESVWGSVRGLSGVRVGGRR